MRWGHGLLEQLGADEIRPNHIQQGERGHHWLLRLGIPTALQDRFGVAPEVLLLAADNAIQGRDLAAALEHLHSGDHRLELDLLVVADPAPDLADRLARLPNLAHIQRIPWPMQPAGPREPLHRALEAGLPMFDLFEQRDPVRGRRVFGRRAEIKEMHARLAQGQSIGVFGLRKMGKTTLVRAVTDQLDPVSAHQSARPGSDPGPLPEESRALVAWLDVEVVHQGTLEALAGRLGSALRRRLEHCPAPLPEAHGDPVVQLQRLIDHAIDRTDLPICLVLDEFDLMFERPGDGQPIAGLDRLFGLFRGTAQATGRLSLIVIGRDPTHIQGPQLDGRTNPMLGAFKPFWTGPLQRGESDDLVASIGRKVGLDVGPKTLETLYEWTGGHPRLLRIFGSALLRISEGPVLRPTDPSLALAVEAFMDDDDLHALCREVLALLAERHPASHTVLVELAVERHDRAGMLAVTGGWLGDGARLLRRLGLLIGSAQAPGVPLYIEWYINTFEAPGRSAATG